MQVSLKQRSFKLLLQPLSDDVITYRRELIVNIILATLTGFAYLAFLFSIQHHMAVHDSRYSTLLINLLFCALATGLWYLSRHNHYRIAGACIAALVMFSALQLTLTYGYELQASLLLYALSIVLVGILLSTRVAFITTGVLVIIFITISYLQSVHRLSVDLSWQSEQFESGNAVGYFAIISVMGVISWLANREIDRSLKHVLASETALAAERDNLEVKVIERTQELEQAQLLRTMELQRFAEFGRVSANLLHEVTNPLTAAALNLELAPGHQSKQVEQARINLRQIERYVTAARQQLQQESNRSRFKVNTELSLLRTLLEPLAKAQHVRLSYATAKNLWLFGNAVKFNQLLSNLIRNAIDSYAGLPATADRLVHITMSSDKKFLLIEVADHGQGISKRNLPLIFDTFFTTKSKTGRGMGIGLELVKHFVEDEFRGTITVTSTVAIGTVFTIRMPLGTKA